MPQVETKTNNIKKSKNNKQCKNKQKQKTKKKQKGGSVNIEPTKSYTDFMKFGDSVDKKLSLYELNGFPGKPPSPPSCNIM